MSGRILYSDSLLEITDYAILFRNYYFPFGSKRIMLSEIGSVSTRPPSLLNGKYRIHGTGDFRTWYPFDLKRPFRDKIFIITFRHKWLRIGFTVEDSAKVEKILQDKNLLAVRSRAA